MIDPKPMASSASTWEILSRLSSLMMNSKNKGGGDADNNTGSVPTLEDNGKENAVLPFFAQRNIEILDENSQTSDQLKFDSIFWKACPIYNPHYCNGSENVGVTGVHSVKSIKTEFIRALKLYSNDDVVDKTFKRRPRRRRRVNRSEMGTLLGMENEDIGLLGNLICTKVNGSSDVQENDRNANAGCVAKVEDYKEDVVICEVYNPTRNEYEYALKNDLTSHLIELINLQYGGYLFLASHDKSEEASRISSFENEMSSFNSNEWCPSLEDMAKINSNNSANSSATSTLSTQPMGTISSVQLAQDMEMTHEDVICLLTELFNETDANTTNGGSKKDQTTLHRKQQRLSSRHHCELDPNITIRSGKTSTHATSRGKACKIELCNKQVLATDQTKYLKSQVLSALLGVTSPTTIGSLFLRGDQHTIIAIAQSLCAEGRLRGTMSASPGTSTMNNDTNVNDCMTTINHATYIPHIYTCTQRKHVDSFFQSNGYLTEKKWIASGLSRNRIEGFVRESFPSSILLKQCVIDPSELCCPLEAAIQSAILNNTLVDLRALLPDDITSSEDDVKEIVNVHLATLLMNHQPTHQAFLQGLLVIDGDIAFFFSQSMVKNAKKLLDSLCEEFGRQRAKEIVENENDGKEDKSSSKSSKRGKHRLQESGDKTSAFSSTDVVPLQMVSNCIAENHPELLEMQQQYEHFHNKCILSNKAGTDLAWEADENINRNKDGPLIAFCRHALLSDELQRMCTRAIKAEADRMNATRHGISVSTMTEGAAKVQNMEEAFESSFKDMCYLLQMLSKSLEIINGRAQRSVGSGETGAEDDVDMSIIVQKMKEELLHGCGSCLALRITEYCLFKHGIEMKGGKNALVFDCETAGSSGHYSSTPLFCQHVDIATLTFPSISPRCKPDENGQKRNPLVYLRSLFPGSLGVGLSRMWSLCSETLQIDESIDNEDTKGGLDLFLSHLEETCLQMVGIPFSILDKKTEKKIMAARRQGLLHVLDTSQDKKVVLTSATVLIYQQVKNVTISGMKTINFVLGLIGRERKIPSLVGEVLRQLKSEDDIPADLLAQAKLFGSAKNAKALSAIAGEGEK